MLPIEVWHKLSSKNLSGLCFGLHKKQNIFTPEIWDFHKNRMLVTLLKKANVHIYKIYKILHDHLFSNKSSRQILFEIPVKSLFFLEKSFKFPFRKRLRCIKIQQVILFMYYGQLMHIAMHGFSCESIEIYNVRQVPQMQDCR